MSSMASLTRHSAARQQSTGVVAGVVLLAATAAGTGLGPAGWLAAIGYAIGLGFLLSRAVRRAGVGTLGPAGLVTLARAVLLGCVTALVVDGMVTGGTSGALLVVLATVALLLDAVDGRVARRTGTASALGARFDMETDALLLLVLSVHVAALLGPWVLAIGTMRYAFVAAGRAAPWLRGKLAPRYAAKVVAALQGLVLVAAASEVVAPPLAVALVAAALALLTWSFARDVGRLWHAAHRAAREPAA